MGCEETHLPRPPTLLWPPSPARAHTPVAVVWWGSVSLALLHPSVVKLVVTLWPGRGNKVQETAVPSS